MPGLTLEQLVKLPWSWQGPTRVESEGEVHWELRIAELPDFFLAGENYDEVLQELRPALRAYLRSYLDRSQEPPLPLHPDLWKVEVAGSVERAPTRLPATTLSSPAAAGLP